MKHLNFLILLTTIFSGFLLSYLITFLQKGISQANNEIDSFRNYINNSYKYYSLKNLEEKNLEKWKSLSEHNQNLVKNADLATVNKWICFLSLGEQLFIPWKKQKINKPFFSN